MVVLLKARPKEVFVPMTMTAQILEIAVLFGLIMTLQRLLNLHAKLPLLYHHNEPLLPKDFLQLPQEAMLIINAQLGR